MCYLCWYIGNGSRSLPSNDGGVFIGNRGERWSNGRVSISEKTEIVVSYQYEQKLEITCMYLSLYTQKSRPKTSRNTKTIFKLQILRH